MSFVYFMEAKGLNTVKIGFAADPGKRLSKVQTDSPVPVAIVAMEEGGLAREAELHKRFEAHRFNREWFRFDPPIRAYIATLPEVCRVSGCRAALGGALGKWMHENGHTVRSAAALFDINISCISPMCAGKQIPRREVVLRIYRLTGGAVTPNALYGIEDSHHAPAHAAAA